MLFYLVVFATILLSSPFNLDEKTMTYLILSKKMDDRQRTKESEKTMICAYINKILPHERLTCSKPPEDHYRNIYQKSYRIQLWEYQEKECFPDIKPSGAILSLSVIFVLIMSCLTQQR